MRVRRIIAINISLNCIVVITGQMRREEKRNVLIRQTEREENLNIGWGTNTSVSYYFNVKVGVKWNERIDGVLYSSQL